MKAILLVLLFAGVAQAKAQPTSTYTKGKCDFLYHTSEYSPYRLMAVSTVWNTFYSCDLPDNASLTMVVGLQRDARGKAMSTTVFSIKGVAAPVLEDIRANYGVYWTGAAKVLADDFGNRFCVEFVADKVYAFCSN